jgi:hypothetical protein
MISSHRGLLVLSVAGRCEASVYEARLYEAGEYAIGECVSSQ